MTEREDSAHVDTLGGSGERRGPILAKIGVFVLLLLALLVISGAVALFLPDDDATVAWAQLLAAGIATWVMVRWIDRRPWGAIGLGRSQARPLVLIEGFALGVIAIATPSLMLSAIGWLRFASAPDGSWWGIALAASWLLVPAALFEEIVVRGYAFDALRRGFGPSTAIAVTSAIFGLLHYANPGATALSIGLVTLAGVFLGVVVLVTGSVWAAWTAHLAWNWTMAVVLHTPVSGLALGTPDYRLVDAGPDWATGGVWGPEGGAGAALGMIGGISYLMARRRRREENRGT